MSMEYEWVFEIKQQIHQNVDLSNSPVFFNSEQMHVKFCTNISSSVRKSPDDPKS